MTQSTNDLATPLAAPADAGANSAAFVRAVSHYAQDRAVVTSRAIYTQHGVKLLEGGVRVDASLYDRLVSHRLQAPLDECIDSDARFDGTHLREASEAAMARIPFFDLMGTAGRVRSMLLQSIESIVLPRPLAFHLMLARDTRPDLYEHSILMALLCAHLVRESGAPIHDMTTAASAGLLHDLGMLHIDADLLESSSRLNGAERRPLYAHPVTSSMLIARFHEYPRHVARAVLEHHERLDGSGYPRGLVGSAISPLGQLLSVCEVVTAMFGNDRRRPIERISLLLRVSAERYDATLVRSLQRLLREVPATGPAIEQTIAESIERLRLGGRLLAQWHELAASATESLGGAGREVVLAMREQAERFQRMMFNAGAAPEQLDLLGSDDAADPVLQGELWALGCEIEWQLKSSANQLRRRWRAATSDAPLPAPIAAWVDAVDALESRR